MPQVPAPRGFGGIVRHMRGFLRSIRTAAVWRRATARSVDNRAFMQVLDRFAAAARSGDLVAADVASQEAMSLAVQQWNEQPPDELEEEAARCWDRRDYAVLEAIRLRQIAIWEARGETTLGLHKGLSSLYLALNRLDDALHQAETAAAAARLLDVPIATAMASKNQGIAYLRLNRVADARKCLEDALDGLDPTDRLYDQSRASLMVSLARCAVEGNDCDEATRYLDTAIDLLRPLEMPLAAGVQADIADWHGVTGRLRQANGDIEGAVAAWTESVERSRLVNSMPHCAGMYTALDLARKLHHHGEALRRAGNHFDAESALAESAEIICDLGLPPQEYG